MSTPTATLTVFDAYNQYLDELSWLTTHAQRCPLGLSDPDQPLSGWCFSLPDDPGHPGDLERQTAKSFIHQGLIFVWYRQKGHVGMQFVWRVIWHLNSGWSDHWYYRVSGGTWQPYPSDFVLDVMIPMLRQESLPS